MNKFIVGFGILVLIIGVIVALLDVSGVYVSIGLNNPFSKMYDLLTEAAVAITFIVVGGILIFWGIKKR
jgi:hypothetical protein